MNLETIKSKIEAIARQKQELVEELRKDFFPLVKPFIDRLPESVESIGWTQYSPYFNDGDECTFSVHTDVDYGIRVNRDCAEDLELFEGVSLYALKCFIKNDDSYEEWVTKFPEDGLKSDVEVEAIEAYRTLEEFSETIRSIDESILEDLFGNHVEIVITRDGKVTTEEYDHD